MTKYTKIFLALFSFALTNHADLRPKDQQLNNIYRESINFIKVLQQKNEPSPLLAPLIQFTRYHAPSAELTALEAAISKGKVIKVSKAISKRDFAALVGEQALQSEEHFRQLLYARVAINLGCENLDVKKILDQTESITNFNFLLKNAEPISQIDPDQRLVINEDFERDCYDFFDTYELSNFQYSKMNALTAINFIIASMRQYNLTIEVDASHLNVMRIEKSLEGTKFYYGPHPFIDSNMEDWSGKNLRQALNYICNDHHLELDFKNDKIVFRDSEIVKNIDTPDEGYWVPDVKEEYKKDRVSAAQKYGKSRRRYECYVKGVGKNASGSNYLVLIDNSRIELPKDKVDQEVLRRLTISLKDWRKNGISERKDMRRQKRDDYRDGYATDQHSDQNEEYHITFTAYCGGISISRLAFEDVEDLVLTYDGERLLN